MYLPDWVYYVGGAIGILLSSIGAFFTLFKRKTISTLSNHEKDDES